MSFIDIATKIGTLVEEKNTAYGDSFKHSGEILKFLYPNGIPIEKYTTRLALVRILDKIFRLATNPNYNNENCWQDIAGYAVLMLGYEQSVTKDPEEIKDPEGIIGTVTFPKHRKVLFTGNGVITTKCGSIIDSDIKE